MKVLTKDLSFFSVGGGPEFESNYDYCLVTPINNEFILTYFNYGDRLAIDISIKDETTPFSEKESILFYLTKTAELSMFDVKCMVAKKPTE